MFKAGRIIELGSMAKNRGDVDTANFLWAILFDLWESKQLTDLVKLEYETQSRPDKGYFDNTYFDLASFELNGCRLNIPVPLLSQDAALKFLMAAVIVNRQGHERVIPEGEQCCESFLDEFDLSACWKEHIRRVVLAPSSLSETS